MARDLGQWEKLNLAAVSLGKGKGRGYHFVVGEAVATLGREQLVELEHAIARELGVVPIVDMPLLVNGQALELIIAESLEAELIDAADTLALRMAAMANAVSDDNGSYFLVVHLREGDAENFSSSLVDIARQLAERKVDDSNAAEARADLRLSGDDA